MSNHKKNILFLMESNETGGAETVVLDIIKMIDTDKFHYIVGLGGYGWLYKKTKEIGCKLKIFKSKGSFNIKYILSLLIFIRKNKIKIIHAHLLGANLYASLASILCGVKVISTFHGESDVEFDKLSSKIKLAIINIFSRRIVFVSEYLRIMYINQYKLNNKKIDVIYNGVDISKWDQHRRNGELRKIVSLSASSILVGAVGDVRKPKGYDILLKTASMMKFHNPDISFVVLGDKHGDLFKKLLQLRSKLDLKEEFHFIGHREDIDVLIHDFDIFVLPSISEGFSICTIEAMAAGIPVIVTKCGGPEEIIINRMNGLIVNANDAIALKQAILEIISNKSLRERLVKQAKKDVKKRFSINNMMMNYQKLYSNIK